MRVTRIRKFKATTEISFVVTREEAEQLAHYMGCKDPCGYPELRAKGRELAQQLDVEGIEEAW